MLRTSSLTPIVSISPFNMSLNTHPRHRPFRCQYCLSNALVYHIAAEAAKRKRGRPPGSKQKKDAPVIPGAGDNTGTAEGLASADAGATTGEPATAPPPKRGRGRPKKVCCAPSYRVFNVPFPCPTPWTFISQFSFHPSSIPNAFRSSHCRFARRRNSLLKRQRRIVLLQSVAGLARSPRPTITTLPQQRLPSPKPCPTPQRSSRQEPVQEPATQFNFWVYFLHETLSLNPPQIYTALCRGRMYASPCTKQSRTPSPKDQSRFPACFFSFASFKFPPPLRLFLSPVAPILSPNTEWPGSDTILYLLLVPTLSATRTLPRRHCVLPVSPRASINQLRGVSSSNFP